MITATDQKTNPRRTKSKKAIKRPPLEANRIYPRAEAAAATGVAVITIIRAFEAGHLEAYRVGRRVLHSGEHLLAWLKAGGQTAAA